MTESNSVSLNRVASRLAQVCAPVRNVLLAASMIFLVTGCATSGNPKDPLEGFNRAMFALNDGLDQVVLKPVATGYENVLPVPVRTGVSNFFGNLGDLFVGANNLLQGKLADGFGDFGRVAVNTTIGLLGVFDVATELGIAKHNEDFGQTLGFWGVGDGPYVVLPVFGPRTARDTVGFVVDRAADPVTQMDHDPSRYAMTVLRIINQRAELLPADKMIDEAALDKYSYIRSAYLQRRRSLIYDGNPPRDRDDD